jgi:hypothetical protein
MSLSMPRLWTVALVSNAQAAYDRNRHVGGLAVGLIERNPEDQTSTSLLLKKANILSPADEGRDFVGTFDEAWCEAVSGKRELADDVDWMREQIGREVIRHR